MSDYDDDYDEISFTDLKKAWETCKLDKDGNAIVE